MLKRIVVLSLAVVPALSVLAQDPSSAQPSPLTEVQGEEAIDYPEVKHAEIERSLKEAVVGMASAVREVKSFVARKGSEKQKEHFWCITEQLVAGRETTMMRVHFASEDGPMIFASKRVFQGQGQDMEELKDKSHVLYFYTDGKVKSYLTRGSPQKELAFYPSGRIEQYDLVEDGVSLAAAGWEEGGKARYEKCKEETDNERRHVHDQPVTQ